MAKISPVEGGYKGLPPYRIPLNLPQKISKPPVGSVVTIHAWPHSDCIRGKVAVDAQGDHECVVNLEYTKLSDVRGYFGHSSHLRMLIVRDHLGPTHASPKLLEGIALRRVDSAHSAPNVLTKAVLTFMMEHITGDHQERGIQLDNPVANEDYCTLSEFYEKGNSNKAVFSELLSFLRRGRLEGFNPTVKWNSSRPRRYESG
jgi:hypothetical protein